MRNLIIALRKIRSKHLIKALGEYYATVRVRSKDVEVFVDPTKKEMLDLINADRMFREFRFIADGITKKVYIWNAEVLHDLMYSELKSKLKGKLCKSLLGGVVGFEDGKLAVTDMYEGNRPSHIGPDWLWINQYFSIGRYLENK